MSQIEPPDTKAQPLLRILVEEILHGRIQAGYPQSFPTYSFLLERLGRPSPSIYAGRRLKKLGLTSLNDWTLQHKELPKITALIVSKGNHLPGKGFAESHGHFDKPSAWKSWWLQQAEEAIRYDWSPFLISAPYKSETGETTDWKVREGEDDTDVSGIIITNPNAIKQS